MKILHIITSALLISITCSCTPSSLTYRNESDKTLWIYGYGETNPIRGCGILAKQASAAIITDRKNKLGPESKVMWTFYEGAETAYFYDSENPKHKTSIIPTSGSRATKDITLIFTNKDGWITR